MTDTLETPPVSPRDGAPQSEVDHYITWWRSRSIKLAAMFGWTPTGYDPGFNFRKNNVQKYLEFPVAMKLLAMHDAMEAAVRGLDSIADLAPTRAVQLCVRRQAKKLRDSL